MKKEITILNYKEVLGAISKYCFDEDYKDLFESIQNKDDEYVEVEVRTAVLNGTIEDYTVLDQETEEFLGLDHDDYMYYFIDSENYLK